MERILETESAPERASAPDRSDLFDSTSEQGINTIVPDQCAGTVPHPHHLMIPVKLTWNGGGQAHALAMIDSGATANFVDSQWCRDNLVPTRPKKVPVPIRTIDGSSMVSGDITHECSSVLLNIGTWSHHTQLDCTHLGHYAVILGNPWLKDNNPAIDWEKGTVEMGNGCVTASIRMEQLSATAAADEEEVRLGHDHPDYEFLAASQSWEDPPPSMGNSYAPERADDNDAFDKDVMEKIPKAYHDFAPLFSKSKADRLPEHTTYDHEIPLVPEAVMRPQRMYGMSDSELKTLKGYLDEMEEKGFIRRSTSPAGAPVIFVKKKDGSLRLCVDYRKLNDMTIKNRTPLPLIKETFDRIRKAKTFTKLDLRGAYNLLRIKAGEEWKTAFRTRYGHYEYCVMPFGLCNAPASFQQMMNIVLHEYLDEFVVCYLDDVLIFSMEGEDHEEHVRKVLRKLQDNNLFVKGEKCEWGVSNTEFLGFRISGTGIAMEASKVDCVRNWPEPKNVKDLQRFLGFANFYRNLVGYYAKEAKLLYGLTKANAPFDWTPEIAGAFQRFKDSFTKWPIRRHFDPDLDWFMETDCSGGALGGILSQYDTDGNLHPVAFHSRTLLDAELRYEIHNKELLAIIDCLKEWSVYLKGNPIQGTIWTDHRNLVHFSTKRELNSRQARWYETLCDFNFVILYRAGKANVKADALSRRSDLRADEAQNWRRGNTLALIDRDHFDPNMLNAKEHQILATVVASAGAGAKQDISLAEEARALSDCAELHAMAKQQPELEWVDGLLRDGGAAIVPDNDGLKLRICERYHDHPIAGHQGITRTYGLIQREWQWKGMRAFVQRYVTNCDTCIRNKSQHHLPNGLLQPLPVPDRPWGSVSLDYIVKLPESQGFDSIMVVVDRLTKMAHFVPCLETQTTAEFAKLYFGNIFKLHGLPDDIVSDRGPHFRSEFWKQLTTQCNITRKLSTAYHPETDGQTERTNQTLETYLRMYCNYKQDDWTSWLPIAEFAYNNATHTATKLSPFYANVGYHPLHEIRRAPEESFGNHINEIQEQLRKNLAQAQENAKRFADRKRREIQPLAIGSQVFLSTKNLNTTRPTKKLDYKHVGPFKVIDHRENKVYKLDLPHTMRVHPWFHPSLLTPKGEDDIPGRRSEPPPPVIIEDQEQYEVKQILDQRKRNRNTEYLIAWEGYGPEFNTWEKATTIEEDVPGMVKEFKEALNKPDSTSV